MSKSDHDQQGAPALPFATTLRKALILMGVGFAVPIVVLLILTHMISKDAPTNGAPASSAAVAASAAVPNASAPASAAHK